MRRILSMLAVGGMLMGVPGLVGCDETVEHRKEVEIKSDGTKVTEEKKVTVDPNSGEVTKTEQKTVDR